MKKVLIALDYNTNSQEIAATGYALAKSMNAQVILLHVMVETGYYSTYEYSPVMGFNNLSTADVLLPDTIDALSQGVNLFLDQAKQQLGDSSIQTLIKDGEPADSIIEAAMETQADIIVLGSHSRSGFEKILMGSVTEKVLKHSHVPLFIIPAKKVK